MLAYLVALIGGSWLSCRWLFRRSTRPSRLDRARAVWMLEDACSFERSEAFGHHPPSAPPTLTER